MVQGLWGPRTLQPSPHQCPQRTPHKKPGHPPLPRTLEKGHYPFQNRPRSPPTPPPMPSANSHQEDLGWGPRDLRPCLAGEDEEPASDRSLALGHSGGSWRRTQDLAAQT